MPRRLLAAQSQAQLFPCQLLPLRLVGGDVVLQSSRGTHAFETLVLVGGRLLLELHQARLDSLQALLGSAHRFPLADELLFGALPLLRGGVGFLLQAAQVLAHLSEALARLRQLGFDIFG